MHPWEYLPYAKHKGMIWRNPVAIVGYGDCALFYKAYPLSYNQLERFCHYEQGYYVVLQSDINVAVNGYFKNNWERGYINVYDGSVVPLFRTVFVMQKANLIFTASNPIQLFNPDGWDYAVDVHFIPADTEKAFSIARQLIERLRRQHEIFRRYWADKDKVKKEALTPEEVLEKYDTER